MYKLKFSIVVVDGVGPWSGLWSTGVGCVANLTDITHGFGNCRSSDICFRDCSDP